MTKHSPKTGVLLTNLGTPDAPTKNAVRKYLAEFLWDPYIVQIPRPIWWLLLHGIILRTRPTKSARLYQKIWTDSGSPLLVYSHALMNKLATALPSFKCALGMRYGKPSIEDALLQLRQQGSQKIIVLPLYPQSSRTTTASTLNQIEKRLTAMAWHPEMTFIPHYASEESYITSLVMSIQDHWQRGGRGQKLLFSFHGIPKRHIQHGDGYYDQCLLTANKVATMLQLTKAEWDVIFQSRFGKEDWLQPYAIDYLANLPKEGCKHVDVICPGFAVDCLETLEEMAITNKKLFEQAGGETFRYIPALNDSDLHNQCLLEIISKYAG